MRFFCNGTVVEWDDARFDGLLKRMGKERIEGARAVILLDVFKVTCFPVVSPWRNPEPAFG